MAGLNQAMSNASAEYWQQLSPPTVEELQADCLGLRQELFSMQGILRWRARADEENSVRRIDVSIKGIRHRFRSTASAPLADK